MRHFIDNLKCKKSPKHIIWSSTIPLKTSIFLWRAAQDRLPTKMELEKRGISMSTTVCPLCEDASETADHLLAQCRFAKEVFMWVFKWSSLDIGKCNSVVEILKFAAEWGNCPKKKKIKLGVIYGALWSIWLTRNDRNFKNAKVNAARTADGIISLVFGWMKNRGKLGKCNWVGWNHNPFLIL